mmetsp:Transcript_429/g.679  ORF Transcript_429/g.679 Transcript_429/m.679 type:complete len:522 (-) Transcript_429:169-1734(-)
MSSSCANLVQIIFLLLVFGSNVEGRFLQNGRCPDRIEVTDRPTQMDFQYIPGPCSAADNDQKSSDKYSCKDFGVVQSPACVKIFPKEKRRLMEETNNSRSRQIQEAEFSSINPYFFDKVPELGEINVNPGQKFSADTVIEIYDETCTKIVQRTEFHSSSSFDLFVGDGYGSLSLVGVANEEQGNISGCKKTKAPTKAPTPVPTVLPTKGCIDTDGEFDVDGISTTCRSINLPGNGWKCKRKIAMDLCPTTCGNEKCSCEDEDTTFTLLKEDLTCKDLELTRYKWACSKRSDIAAMCPKTCGICPCAYSMDDTKVFNAGQQKDVTCTDLSTNPSLQWTCSIDKFQDRCPISCGICPCADSSKKIRIGTKKRTCDKLTKPKFNNYCDKAWVKQRCMKSCGVCGVVPTPNPTFRPTTAPPVEVPGFSGPDAPTLTPTVVPSLFPTVVPSLSPTAQPTLSPKCPQCSQCYTNPQIMCNAWYCPTNVGNGHCTYCTYQSYVYNRAYYYAYCILSPWHMTISTCNRC